MKSSVRVGLRRGGVGKRSGVEPMFEPLAAQQTVEKHRTPETQLAAHCYEHSFEAE